MKTVTYNENEWRLVPMVATDLMVSCYVAAVNEHLGGLTAKDWERERKDQDASIRRVARIGINAMLEAAPSSDLEALRRDAERLNFLATLIAKGRRIEFAKSLIGSGVEFGLHAPIDVVIKNNLREAIDAMAGRGKVGDFFQPKECKMSDEKEETAGEMLERLGADAMKWAKEFRKTAIRLGYSDMPEDWLVGWFANAIEYGHMVKSKR